MSVGTGEGVSVGTWAVGAATMDLAMAVVVAEMSGVGIGVGPQAAVKVTIRTRGNSFSILLSSLASTWMEGLPSALFAIYHYSIPSLDFQHLSVA